MRRRLRLTRRSQNRRRRLLPDLWAYRVRGYSTLVEAQKKRKTPLRHAIEWVVALALGAGFLYAVMVTGIRVSPVVSDSMRPQFERGDAVLYVNTATRAPQEGDVIVFTAHLDSTTTLPVVHRWVDTGPEGQVITKGDNNDRRDPWPTTTADIQGVQIAAIPTHYLRNPWTAPIAGTILAFVIIASLALAFLKNDDDENPVADDNEPTPARRSFTHRTETAQATALAADKARKKTKPAPEALDWYSGGEDRPGAPARFPWLEPNVQVITPVVPVIPANNTFATVIAEAARPHPVIPDGWTPANSTLPPDPEDIYLAQPSPPVRPQR